MRFRRIVVGLDGSAHSRRALALVARMAPARGGRVDCVRVVEPVRMPSAPLLPASMRSQLAAQAASLERTRTETARRQVDAAAARLEASGWRARGQVRIGLPVAELLAAVKAARADVLVVGARGAGGLTHFLLGSVAEAEIRHAPVPVLIVK